MSLAWRYRCPEGHTTTYRREDGHYCGTCGERFDDLVDTAKDGVSFR